MTHTKSHRKGELRHERLGKPCYGNHLAILKTHRRNKKKNKWRQNLKELSDEVYSQRKTAEMLSEEFGYNFTRNAVKNREAVFQETERLTKKIGKTDKLVSKR